MSSQPAHMWPYWLEDKGYDSAIKDYFADLFTADPILALAKVQRDAALCVLNTDLYRVRVDRPARVAAKVQHDLAEATIDARMKQLADEERSRDDD